MCHKRFLHSFFILYSVPKQTTPTQLNMSENYSIQQYRKSVTVHSVNAVLDEFFWSNAPSDESSTQTSYFGNSQFWRLSHIYFSQQIVVSGQKKRADIIDFDSIYKGEAVIEKRVS